MAYTSGSLLGTYAPAMQEPYAIESTLAPASTGGSSALANSLLNTYWSERQAREAQYAQRLGDQMAFGQQQLRAQLMDTYAKSVPEFAKSGTLGMMATTPMFAGLGADPGAVQQAIAGSEATQAATNFGNVGRGLTGAANYGLNIPPPNITGMTGMQGLSQGTPVPLQVAQERTRGMLGAASIRAAAAGGGNNLSTSIPDPGIEGMPAIPTYHASGKMTPQQISDQLLARGVTPPKGYPPPRTNLPASPAPAGNQPPDASQPQQFTPLPTVSKEGQQAQNIANTVVQTLKDRNDPRYGDLQLQGTTVHNIVKDQSGGIYLVGRSKAKYKIN